LAKTISIYLYKSSIKQQVLAILARLDIYNSYKSVNKLVTNITKNAKKSTLITSFIKLYI